MPTKESADFTGFTYDKKEKTLTAGYKDYEEANTEAENPEVTDETETSGDTADASVKKDKNASITDEEEEFETDDTFVTIPEDPNNKLLKTKELEKETKTLLKRPLLTTSEVPTQTPVTGDGITIEKVLIRWLSKSTGEEEPAKFDDLVLEPTDDVAPNQQWQLDFALSGKGYLDAGAVEIVIPAYIWLDRDGKEPGRLTLAIPEDPDNSQEFAWKRVDDKIVITNTRKISAATKYMIQGTFRMTYPDPNSDKPFTTTPAHQMVDIDTTDDEAAYKGISDDLFATVNVVTPTKEEVLTMESNAIRATINTYIEASSATKKAVGSVWVKSVPTEIPNELLPNNPDDYYYVQWYCDGTAKGNQPFTMTIDDAVTDEYNGIMLGISDAVEGTVVSDNDEDVSATLFTGYSTAPKACYVWTAYPKSQFDEEGATYTLHNTHTVTVTGADDEVVTTKTADAEISFRAPITWHIQKVWDYNEEKYDTDLETIIERRPDNLKVWMENKSKEGTPKAFEDILNDDNEWKTEWTDDGSVSNYEAYEYSYDVSRYGHMPNGSSRYYLTSGYTDWKYNDDGTYTRYHWWYDREKTVYDETTHTWTFYNCYHEALEHGRIAEHALVKSATNHRDNRWLSTYDKDLQLLRDGKESTTLTYNVSTSTWMFELTRDPEKERYDMSGHGKNYVILDLDDHDEYFEARHLNDDEYYFQYVQMRPAEIYDWIPDGEESSTGEYSQMDTVPVDLYGRLEGNWVKYATLNADGTVTAENGATAVGLKVTFPEGVTRVKEEIRTNGARARLSYDVGIILKPSEDIVSDVNRIFDVTDYGMARSFNYVTSNLYSDNKEELLSTLTRYDATYLHGRNYRVAEDLDKTTTFTETNRTDKYLRFKNEVTLNQQSNITVRKFYEDAVRDGEIPVSESGTFYDLLPPGMQADIETVEIENGSVKTVDIIDNYMNSGRQLLIVKADLGDTISTRGYNISDDKSIDILAY